MAGLVRTKKVFTSKWVAGLQEFARSGMYGKIELFTSEVTYTGYVPSETRTKWYEGEARIQPVGAPSQKEIPGDDSKIQRVRFQIPIEAIGLELVPEEWKVEVTECPLNPSILNYLYTVKEVMDSGNPLEKTFEAEVVTDLGEA